MGLPDAYQVAGRARRAAQRLAHQNKGKRAQKAMEAAIKKHPRKNKHTYDAQGACNACSHYMAALNNVPFEHYDLVGCRLDPPGGVNWQGVSLHVNRAKCREHFVEEGIVSGSGTPAELFYTLNESKIEWVFALMYLLGWKRPEWAKDWEWL